MKHNKFTLYLLVLFISTTILVVFLQFNSNLNFNKLIAGNEELLTEFEVKTKVQDILIDMTYVSNEQRMKIESYPNTFNDIKEKEEEIKKNINYLNKLQVNEPTREKLRELGILAKEFIRFQNHVLDSFLKNKKLDVNVLMQSGLADSLTLNIIHISNELNTSRDQSLADFVKKADINGRAAKTWGLILAIVTVITNAFAFFYITHKIRQQEYLIDQLNESERRGREAIAIKENFMANMSHEIRTPMNAILGFTHLLEKQKLDPKSEEFIRSIKSSAESLLTIINDVLDFSKIEAGMMRIEPTDFSIRGLLHSVRTMFWEKAKEKKINLETSIDPELPDVLFGDAVRLTQILVNLTGNALKFTSSGTISITVQKEKEIDELVFIHFSVKDTGIGIPKSKIDSVFERFHQGDEDTTRKYGGTGLGLAIVKQLVDIQGGTISVKSEEGKGSEFSFTIPYKIVKDGHHLINLPFNENQEDTFIDYPITILVVEDNVMNQNLIKYLFTDWGIHFTISPNGALAIEELKKHSFDLILMDIQMPEMNGYTATQIIREQLHLDTPIVAMTAHAMAGEREKCLSYGMNDYISKPVKEKELYKIIRNLTTNNFIQNNIFSEHQPVEKENNFEIIDIRYLQEITGQRSASQVVLTKQFIEHIPTEVADLENCLKESNYLKAKQVAHNLKTSISIMGLTSKLNEALDYIENHVIQEERSIIIESYFTIIKSVCKKAVDEAKSFLSHLQQSHPSES